MPTVVTRLLALPLFLAALAGCGDSFSPTVENVSGAYTATFLTVTDNIETRDYLADGASLEVTLLPDATTEGHLFVPGGDDGGGDLDISLEGTWSLVGSTVTIESIQDTFLQDIDFTATENQLDGEFVGNGVLVSVRLEKPGSSD